VLSKDSPTARSANLTAMRASLTACAEVGKEADPVRPESYRLDQHSTVFCAQLRWPHIVKSVIEMGEKSARIVIEEELPGRTPGRYSPYALATGTRSCRRQEFTQDGVMRANMKSPFKRK
jgi:hypothetical protein